MILLLADAKHTALQVGWSQARDGGGMEQKTKLSITCSIFELEVRNFAWKFVWIVRTNYKSIKSTNKYISTKVLITQPFFDLLTSDFAWKFIWTVEPNDKVQKYKKYKKYKNYKKYKTTKKQKYKN